MRDLSAWSSMGEYLRIVRRGLMSLASCETLTRRNSRNKNWPRNLNLLKTLWQKHSLRQRQANQRLSKLLANSNTEFDPYAHLVYLGMSWLRQIGRASCRERV